MMGFDADVYPVALSYDGTEMILYFDDDYIGNLYYSRMEDGLWTPATKLGENISTKYWESHACFSKDGQSLYFTSNRKGTHGGLDIYLSEKQADGKWGPPVNLGSSINTRYNEESPYISEDGQTLYFSSYGHYNMGGYDIFYSKKNPEGTWAEPVNIGYPINTTDDDLFFQPFDKGNAAYYAVYSPSGIGQHDIYYMNIYSVNNPRFYMVSGTVHTEDGSEGAAPVAIYVIDTDSGDTAVYTSPGDEGSFAFQLKQGIYELHFTGKGYEELIRPLQITLASNKQGIKLEDDLVLALEAGEAEPEEEAEIFEGEESQIKLRETQVEVTPGVPLVVPVIAPKGSVIVVRTYQDSVLISTDTLVTEKRRTQLQIVPLPGESEVELELRDKDGNIHRNRLLVVGSVAEPQDAREILDEMPGDEDSIEPVEPRLEEPLGILLYEMLSDSDGALQTYLLELDPEQEGIESQEELISHLYEQADSVGYTPHEVDVLLAEVLSDGEAILLLQHMLENSEGSLKLYLGQLDLDAESITSSEDLLKHLERAAETEEFTMEDVREAMLDSLGKPLEVCRVYEEALLLSEGNVRELLESLDLQGSDIYTVDQLIMLLDSELESRGLSKKERAQILSELFGEQYRDPGSGNRKTNWALTVVLPVAAAGLIFILIVWWRRREKSDKQGD
jgi:hypothetical protein